MNIEEFLSDMRDAGVRFSVHEGKLRSQGAKGAINAEAQAKIREHKDAIIAFLVAASGSSQEQMPLVRISRDQRLPLSFAQQRLWFLDQLESGSALYNVAAALRLRGRLDESALKDTFNEIVRRHEALRTSFSASGDTAEQVIAERLALTLPVTDLTVFPQPEREAKARRLKLEEAQTPFNLSTGPVIRLSLLKLAHDEHILLLTLHHIVADGWSIGVLIREMAALYDAYVHHQASPLPELSIQYADFAHWQRQWLTGDVLDTQLGYWKKRLQGAPSLLALPTDRPRPAELNHAGATVNFIVPENTASGLYAMGKATQSSLFMTLAAAFNVLLGRYSGQNDICIGMPIANRNRADIEPLIGFFINTLVLRTQLEGNPTFNELQRQVRDATLGAYDHQDVPFEQLVETLKPERSASHSPLFQVMLNLQNAPMGALALSGLSMEPIHEGTATSKYDLRLSVVEEGAILACAFEYSTDLFDAATIERMSGHFNRLLEAIVADPNRPISSYPMQDAAESRRLLAQWDRVHGSFSTIVDADLLRPLDADNVLVLFDRAVQSSGEKTAIRFKGGALSYNDLDALSNQVGNGLTASGPVVGKTVAIFLEDGVLQVAAMLGVLKAGGIFASLNPSHPEQRLADIIEIVVPARVVSQSGYCEQLESLFPLSGARPGVLFLDAVPTGGNEPQARRQSAAPVGVEVDPDAPCYLYFTSGSTGKPKAVLGRVRGLAHFIQWEIETFGLTAGTNVSQLTTPTFDVYLRDIFAALCCGGTVCIPEPDAVLDPETLADWLDAADINLMHCVPTLFRTLLEADMSRPRFPGLRHILLAGEALLPADANRWIGIFGERARLVNIYGPTETTLAKFCYRLPAVPISEAFVPVGRPIPGAQAIILSDSMEPCSPGQVGEIHIRTPYRSLGYHAWPDLNEAAFVRNPFTPGAEDILYKTGDVGCVLPDGNFRLLGRKDFQVKIRGMRIELGEIEAALAALPEVKEAVVLARDSATGDKQLVAYVAATTAAVELRERLAQSLPDYMVPSHFVLLDALPLSPNGKVDRKALPEPDISHGEVSYVAPRTAIEEILAGIWADVLKLEKVGIDNNFFALGGHSLLATQVMSKVRAAFDIDMPLRALFDAPTVGALSQRIAVAQEESAQLLAPAIVKVERNGAPALSFAQQRLWFLDQFDTGSAKYNIPATLRLVGRLDVAALKQTLNEIVRRHEALRTSFATVDGSPLQGIAEQCVLTLPMTDLSDLPAQEREACAQRLIQDEVGSLFDLAAGPLIRARLIRIGEAEHIMLVTLHHIVSDGWSRGVLTKEMSALYTAYVQGQPSPLPELEIQYADFAHWQRQWLSGEALEQQLDYWKQHLAGAPTLLTLPTDRPRPAIQRHGGANVSFAISAQTKTALQRVNQDNQCTLFMTLTAVFNVLLSRYSGQSDLCIGTPIANRNRAEIEGLIGFFVNTLVLHTHVDANATFTELLKQVRNTTLGAYAHQDVPFEKLVEALNPERHVGHSPLFQVMLVLQNAPQGNLALPDLTLVPMPVSTGTAKFDLLLDVAEVAGQLCANFEYNTDLFDRSTIERMAGHMTRLLEAVAADPGSRIGELPMLSDAERAQQLQEWNPAGADYTSGETLHQQFERQAQRTPEAVALAFEEQTLSYGQLNAKANRLAHYLRSQGVGPDVLVALCLDRSPDMIVALLAVLKAGGAYVPLDPAYPTDRLAYIIEDAKPALLLTQSSHAGLLQELDNASQGKPVATFRLDSQWQQLDGYDDSNPLNRTQAENLAYVIYTSGSTGKPKGTLLPHRNVTRLFAATDAWFHFTDKDVWTLFHSYAFDFSVWEIWGALLHGGKLVIVPYLVSRSPDLFHSLLLKERVTILNQTPSAFLQLAEVDTRLPQSPPLALRQVIFGGEALNEGALTAWFDKHGDSSPELINMYGITETTVHVTYHRIDAHKRLTACIGRPIPDLGIYLLDEGLNPVPIGVAGELHVSGEGLARGYLNRADLTAAKFIPHPYSRKPGALLYKSGDLASYRADGKLTYLGRIDHQVKIRGFRIELGEIEAALQAHPSLDQVLVLAREDNPGDKRLVAYYVAVAGEQVQEEVLRAMLHQALPDYMVPSHFIGLERFPLTGNGKIDRKALPAPEASRSQSGYAAPGTATEEILAGIWAEVLKLDKVGIHDNFFELGGHSLLATQVMSKVRAAFETEIPLRAMFDGPSVHALGHRVDAARQDSTQSMAPAIVKTARNLVTPLSFAQQRLWFLDQLDPGNASYSISGALRLTGRLDVPAFEKTLNEIVRRHEALRTTFVTVGGNPVQVIAEQCTLSLPVTDLSDLAPGEQEAQAKWLAQDRAQTPFDLATGPLMRASLLRMGATEHILLVTLHHIVSDGWSMGILTRETTALYTAYVQGQPSPLPELEIQYADFARWQRHWLSGEVLAQQLDYWKQHLAGAPTLLTLPTDHPRPLLQTYRGDVVPFAVSPQTTAALQRVNKENQCTLFMTLTAAFNVLLSRYSGQSDLCIGTPIANRNRAEIENLIGFFVNTLVLHTHVDANASFADLLKQVRSATLGAYEHQDVPFEQLVEVLNPERRASHSPLFQVMLSLQNEQQGNLTLPGLTLAPLAGSSGVAKFDLTLFVTEQADHLSASLEYNTDLFERTTIERMAGHFTRLLDAIAANPAARIQDLPMLGKEEMRQLVEWNATAAAYPNMETIHGLFEAQAAKTPEAVAVEFEGRQLRYGELNAKANQLAHYLRSEGVGPDVLVAICIERSLEMVIGLLGILKAGGAYMPLDPDYPKDRLAYMLDDARPAVLLTQQHLRSSVPAESISCLSLDTHWKELSVYPQHNLQGRSQPDNLAYVIYTSGSTGRPKGALISHRNVVRLVKGTNYFAVGETDKVLSYAPLVFDACTFEIWGGLLNGATLAMPGPARLSVEELGAFISENGIHTMWLTAALFNQMVEHQLPSLASVKHILAGGEALSVSHVRKFIQANASTRLTNGYGPTESTTFTCCHPIAPLSDADASVSIGRPIANTQVYLLDASLNPVPVGVAGELHIGGDGLARGYLNRAELTAEKFIPHPFGGAAGERLYKSGDLARYLPDGSIEYLGRIDQQVKIRGFRIELGEIEAALSALPQVREAVVLAREDVVEGKCLVAYVVGQVDAQDETASEQALQAEVLRGALAQTLPDYMVPGYFVALEALPLTPNGKIDRKALPAPDMVRSASGYVAPRSPTEEIMAGIWAQVLGLDRVGIHDNFFALGGHSLLATQAMSKVRTVFAVDIPLRVFFGGATIAELASRIDYAILLSAASDTSDAQTGDEFYQREEI